jgi:hypothetical protein
MAYQRLQVGRALGVIPSDTINIPNLAAIATSGTASSIPVANRLLDTLATFVSDSVKVGDIIYSGTEARKVVAVLSETLLEIDGPTIGVGNDYTVYSQADSPSNGCTLYVGLAGNLTVETVGGDVVQFTGVPTGSFIPVQVLKVMSTGTDAQNIVALW